MPKTASDIVPDPSQVVDRLGLTQLLVMEVLAGRYRLGEGTWTFAGRTRPALRALESAGLVGWQAGGCSNTALAWLTDMGKEGVLLSTYTPPVLDRVSEYTIYPAGCDQGYRSRGASSFAVRVQRRDGGAWAVVHAGRTLSRSGELVVEGASGELTKKYLARHRFDCDVAIAKAEALAETVVVNGRTWARWRAHVDAGG